ncbi:MAG: universal stress protein [Gemmatimonadota bacterium]
MIPQRLRTLVAGVADPGSAADPVLVRASRVADRTGADLHAVHVFEEDPLYGYAAMPSWDPAGGAVLPDPEGQEPLRGLLLERLRAAAARVRPAGSTTCHVVAGSPAEALRWVGEQVGADLLVAGASHHGSLGQRFLGTTAGRVLRQAEVPVLVVRDARRPLPGARVLLASDLSEASARAYRAGLRVAVDLCAGDTAALRCVLVVRPGPALVPPLPVGVPHHVPEAGGALAESAAPRLRDFVAEHTPHGLAVEATVRVGDPAGEIVAEAVAWAADLVVLGTHGRAGLHRLLLGSVAEAVLRGSPCDALVVPSAATDDAPPSAAPA